MASSLRQPTDVSNKLSPRRRSASATQTRRTMHVYANPARFLKIARPLTAWLGWAGAALIAGALGWGLFAGAAPSISRARACASSTSTSPPPGSAWRAGPGSRSPSLMQLVWRHPLAAVAAPRARRAGRGVHRHLPRHRLALGPADLGHLLGMGRADDLDARPALPLSRLSSRWPTPSRRRAGRGGSPPSSAWSARSTCRSSIIR